MSLVTEERIERISNEVEARKDEFGSLAIWLTNLLDDLAEGKNKRELHILEEHFLTTSKFEYMFWDMVCQGGD